MCFCTIHQNVKLMLDSVNISEHYMELLELLVCNTESRDCMVHRCDSCPDTSRLQQYLLEEISKNDDDDDDDEEIEIEFKQWTTVDRAELVSKSLPVDEFIEDLITKLNNLTTHSYIAKAQSRYLREMKENLNENEVVVLLDLAENYTYVIQDESQGCHQVNE